MNKPPKIPNSKDWKNILINEYKFKYISSTEEIPTDCIWATSCSKTKKSRKKGYPKEFYQGRYNKNFYKSIEKNDFEYGVISDKYGIHMFDEKLDYYNIHPSELSYENKKELGRKIKEKVSKYDYNGIIFYYPSPLLSKPYFEILWYSRLPIYYISKIKLLEDGY